MARRRVISASGHMKCTHCDTVKHISQFYQSQQDEPWWIDPRTSAQYGKPSSWCSDCMKAHHKGKKAGEQDDELREIEEAVALGPPRKETAVTGHWDPDEWGDG